MGQFGKDEAIGHGQQRGTVDDDEVESVGKLGYQLGHCSRLEQLSGIRWDLPRGQNVQIIIAPCLQQFIEAESTDQGSRQSHCPLKSQACRHRGATQVGVDEDNTLPCACTGDGQVDPHRRLAFSRP